MKKTAIILLVCINVALLAALVAGAMPRAEAQVSGRAAPPAAPNYLLLTGHIMVNEDVVYVVDVNTGKLLAWEFDHKTKRLKMIRLGRNLVKDFGGRTR